VIGRRRVRTVFVEAAVILSEIRAVAEIVQRRRNESRRHAAYAAAGRAGHSGSAASAAACGQQQCDADDPVPRGHDATFLAKPS
jgi:hypothetical protein